MNALDLIKQFEGLELDAYQDCVGVWTIGYGTTRIENRPVQAGMHISQEKAEQLALAEIKKLRELITREVKTQLSANQIEALIDFCYNLGFNAFKQSTMIKLINQNKIKDAANEFDRWVYAGGKKLAGLVKRRAAEKSLFLS